jgi:hypothetical protein
MKLRVANIIPKQGSAPTCYERAGCPATVHSLPVLQAISALSTDPIKATSVLVRVPANPNPEGATATQRSHSGVSGPHVDSMIMENSDMQHMKAVIQ